MSINLNILSSTLLLLVSFAFVTCLKLTSDQEIELHNMILNRIQFTIGQRTGAGFTHIQKFNEKTTNGMIVYAQFIDNLNVAEAQRHCTDLKKNETFMKLGIAGLETYTVSKPVAFEGRYTLDAQSKLKCFVSRFHFIYDLLLWAKKLKGSKPDELFAPKPQPGENQQKSHTTEKTEKDQPKADGAKKGKAADVPKKTPGTVEEAIALIENYFAHVDKPTKAIWDHLSTEGHNVPFDELAEIFDEPFANEKATKEGESELKLPCLNPNASESADKLAKEVLQNGKSVLNELAHENKTPAKDTTAAKEAPKETAKETLVKETPAKETERLEHKTAKESEQSESAQRKIVFTVQTDTYVNDPEALAVGIVAGLCAANVL